MKEIKFIKKEIDALPPETLKDVADFINYIKYKYRIDGKPMKISDTVLASEKSLAKDWLTPEEEEAWKHL